ncbi:MAG: 6,7-dimethyl-8-ribityllumazine synthase [Candidatus Rokubacteria bacterium]|nr:6,7-dimethyl-8-ribityllumazine synthase [Candidatus Rokubacteria bacterium]
MSVAGRAPKRRVSASGLTGNGPRRFAIVAARFNERISERLVDGARDAFEAAKIPAEDVEVHWVPGAFELPQAASLLAARGGYAAIVCVGCVIRGETPHFDFVAGEAAAGIREVGVRTGVPTTFGVITALTEDQAWARAGGAVGNRGTEAAEAAIEMAEFASRLEETRSGRHAARTRRSR